MGARGEALVIAGGIRGHRQRLERRARTSMHSWLRAACYAPVNRETGFSGFTGLTGFALCRSQAVAVFQRAEGDFGELALHNPVHPGNPANPVSSLNVPR